MSATCPAAKFRKDILTFFLVPKPRLRNASAPEAPASAVSRHGKPGLPRQMRSQAGAWEREKIVCKTTLQVVFYQVVCKTTFLVPKPGLGNEKKYLNLCAKFFRKIRSPDYRILIPKSIHRIQQNNISRGADNIPIEFFRGIVFRYPCH